MLLTPEEREWLVNRRTEINEELEQLSAADPGDTVVDRNERRAELLLELEDIEDEIGDEPA